MKKKHIRKIKEEEFKAKIYIIEQHGRELTQQQTSPKSPKVLPAEKKISKIRVS